MNYNKGFNQKIKVMKKTKKTKKILWIFILMHICKIKMIQKSDPNSKLPLKKLFISFLRSSWLEQIQQVLNNILFKALLLLNAYIYYHIIPNIKNKSIQKHKIFYNQDNLIS